MQATEQVLDITERAARQIAQIIQSSDEGLDKFLRIGVKGGGCSGLSYTLGFDEKTDKDIIQEKYGVQFIVDKRHAMYLKGTVLDFKDGLDARGFIFENPTATSTCGCGSSFSA